MVSRFSLHHQSRNFTTAVVLKAQFPMHCESMCIPRLYYMLGWETGCPKWRLAGMVPLRLVRPMVGRSPTQAQWDAGPRVLSPVSVPSDACAKPAATAAALPPLDPAEQVLCAVLCYSCIDAHL